MRLISQHTCTANQVIQEKYHTIIWYVDNTRSSQEQSKVNEKIVKLLTMMYASNDIGKVKYKKSKEAPSTRDDTLFNTKELKSKHDFMY